MLSDEKHEQAERHLRDRLNEKYPDALAAVRADERKVQIEKDAEIVDRQLPEMGPHINVSEYRQGRQSALVDAANALRAQLTTKGEN